MDMKKRRDMQLLYVADEAIMEEQSVCRKKLQKLNFMDRSDFDGVAETVKDLLGKTGKTARSILRFTVTMALILRWARIFLQTITA